MMESAFSISSTALENKHIFLTKPCTLAGITGFNTGPDQFIFIYDGTDVGANSTVPTVAPLAVFANMPFSFSVEVRGVTFNTGCAACNSTTGNTKTLGAADCFFTAYFY